MSGFPRDPTDRFSATLPPAQDAPAPARLTADADGVWVFAYGSLMWRPDFLPAEIRAARLVGWHRCMCILSTHYRGTVERPGLVLGLDRGGSCLGRALRVMAAEWEAVRALLHEREMITGVYIPRFVTVHLDDGRRVAAYAFTVDRSHPQYWSGPAEQAAALIRQGTGPRGTSRDYLASTVEHLRVLGMRESALHRLLRLVDGDQSRML